MLWAGFFAAIFIFAVNIYAQQTPDDPVVQPTYPDPPAVPSPLQNNQGLGHLGEINASGISFNYLNNFLILQQLHQHLRNVPLVTYHGDMGGETGNAAGYPAEYSTGGYDTAPYGPGYAPAYEQSIYNSGYPVYDQNGAMIDQPQTSNAMPSVYRGQAAQYGDPGTLIYSLWGSVIGGDGTVKVHKAYPGYKTEQYGGLVGLDLFCSTDCRSGLFYAFQQGKMKDYSSTYNYTTSSSGDLYNPEIIPGLTADPVYRTEYVNTGNFSGKYSGTLKTQNHLLGIYHEFGDEVFYNIATLRGGFNKIKATESLSETGTTAQGITQYTGAYDAGLLTDAGWTTTGESTTPGTGTRSGSLSEKYNEFLGGVSFERGAHFNLSPFTLTPRAGIDYTYLHRDKCSANDANMSVQLKKGNYHSLRTNLGGDIALDMYPGETMHIRLLGRASWAHEFLSYIYGKTNVEAAAYNYTLAESVKGNTFGRDWAVAGAGVEWTIVPAFMVFGDYDYMLNKYLRQHYGQVGAKLMW